MKKTDHEEALRRLEYELSAFGSGSIFNKKAPAVRERIMELEAKLLELEYREVRNEDY